MECELDLEQINTDKKNHTTVYSNPPPTVREAPHSVTARPETSREGRVLQRGPVLAGAALASGRHPTAEGERPTPAPSRTPRPCAGSALASQ